MIVNQPKEASLTPIGVTNKTNSEMDHQMRRNINIQGTTQDPEKPKTENFVPTTEALSEILEVMGVPGQMKELESLVNKIREKPRNLSRCLT